MKPSKRSSIALIVGGMAATAAIIVPSGSAQAPGTTTLTFYEPDAQSVFKIVDNFPRSPRKNPENPKYRFSIGDELTIRSPLYDTKGGNRLGTLYAESTIVQGTTFRTARFIASGTYVLNDGSQIAVHGYFSFSGDTTVSVTGGTGTYEGARGHMTTHSTDNDSTDTLTLLP
jgi:hypothetical protein